MTSEFSIIKKATTGLILLIIAVACSSTDYSTKSNYENLIDNIELYFNDSMFEHAYWGALIKSLDDGKIWYERNQDKLFMPASNQKIPTTACALLNLGPDYMFKTYIQTNGVIEDSVLKGDLIIFSNGDPTIYDRFFDSPLTVFRMWVDSLKAKGINKIAGDIIGNDNAFDDQSIGSGWSHDYLDAWYAAEIGALQFNENVLDINIIKPKTISDKTIIEPNVESNYFTIIDSLTITDTGRTRVRYFREFGTNEILLKGRITPGDDTLTVSPSIYNPTLFYVTKLKEVFEEGGIEVEGKPVDVDDISLVKIQNAGVLFEHTSPPLKDIIKVLLKRSQNLYAETMTRALGYEKFGIGSFRNGEMVVEETLQQIGIEPETYSYADGSGLTRYNFISPNEIVKILEYMYNSEYSEYWIDALPIAGVDGTLKYRMRGTAAEGNVKAKTGTISNVRGLSGYVTTADGQRLVFSFLVNAHLRSTADTEYITDNVLRMIAEFKR